MSVYDTDVVVIGAGVIGLACAREMALRGREVVLLERESQIATQTSSRNSEVIHAGLYYPTGSLKARLCVAGRRMLYEYLDERGISYKKCGKLIVASSEIESEKLRALHERAISNEVEGIEHLDGTKARELEPALSDGITSALVSPQTGIFDGHSFCLSLLGDFENAGGTFVRNASVVSGKVTADSVHLNIAAEEAYTLKAQSVINAAGLQAIQVAHLIEGDHQSSLPKAYFAKGHYFSVSGKTPFRHLIYPMPNGAGLGIHLTLDLQGSARLGPDVEWLDTAQNIEPDFSVPEDLADTFLVSAQRFWPELKRQQLLAGYAGIRPKLVAPGAAPGDFLVHLDHSNKLCNLLGIESPGLTASLAIANHVAQRILTK
jgi:L-2-hydroxyglutarate oxidase LhgO